MVMKLYALDLSPPVRAVMMACEIFNVTYEKIEVNYLEKKKQMDPEFMKKNPSHTVPVLEDGDYILQDSHAILMYLADTYGKDDSWYPKDVRTRALVNQKLFFDTGILFPRLRSVTLPLYAGEKKIPQRRLDAIKEAYGFLEDFLSKSSYVAGDHVTIADLSIFSDVSSLVHVYPIDKQTYPKITAWLREMEKKPYSIKHNQTGAAALGRIIKQLQE